MILYSLSTPPCNTHPAVVIEVDWETASREADLDVSDSRAGELLPQAESTSLSDPDYPNCAVGQPLLHVESRSCGQTRHSSSIETADLVASCTKRHVVRSL